MNDTIEKRVIEYHAPWSDGAGCFGVFVITTEYGKRIREVSYIKAKELLATGTYHFKNVRKDRHGKAHVTLFEPGQFEAALEWIKTYARR